MSRADHGAQQDPAGLIDARSAATVDPPGGPTAGPVRFTWHERRIGGPEGERLRREQAAIVKEILEWVRNQRATGTGL